MARPIGVIVPFTIYLDRESRRRTEEVENVRAHRMLSAEAKAVQRACAQ
jgi:hypothetical protein